MAPTSQPNLTLSATQTSREWFRPNPPLPSIKWGPRNNTNIQESALLIALNKVAKDRDLYLENYWLKNKRAIEKGKNGPNYAWVIPAAQRRKADAADMVNELRRQGVEVSVATAAFKAGNVDVPPATTSSAATSPITPCSTCTSACRTIRPPIPAPMTIPAGPCSTCATSRLIPVTDKAILDEAHDPAHRRRPGRRRHRGHRRDAGSGAHQRQHPDGLPLQEPGRAACSVAEEDFDLDGHKFRAGAFIIPNADRARLEPQLHDLGLSAWAVDAAPAVKTHDLHAPAHRLRPLLVAHAG